MPAALHIRIVALPILVLAVTAVTAVAAAAGLIVEQNAVEAP